MVLLLAAQLLLTLPAVPPGGADGFCNMVVAVARDASGPESVAAAELAALAGQVRVVAGNFLLTV